MTRQSMLSTLLGRDLRGDVFGDLHEEIDRVFNRFREIPPFTPAARLEGSARMVPRTDIAETDGAIEVELELPGVKLEDVDVEIVDTALVVRGSLKSDAEREDRNYHVVERSRGEFLRRVPLGFDVDADKVRASFADGVLSVTVDKPSTAAGSTKRVEVKPAGAIGSDREAPGRAEPKPAPEERKRDEAEMA